MKPVSDALPFGTRAVMQDLHIWAYAQDFDDPDCDLSAFKTGSNTAKPTILKFVLKRPMAVNLSQPPERYVRKNRNHDAFKESTK
jgi:hypothetical protein